MYAEEGGIAKCELTAKSAGKGLGPSPSQQSTYCNSGQNHSASYAGGTQKHAHAAMLNVALEGV